MSDWLTYRRKYTILSNDEQVELVRRAKDGDISAQNELIESNIPFLIARAKRINSNALTVDDLVSVGCIGMVLAIKRFREDAGVQFLTAARISIDSEMNREVFNAIHIVKIPEGTFKAVNRSISNGTFPDNVKDANGRTIGMDVVKKAFNAMGNVSDCYENDYRDDRDNTKIVDIKDEFSWLWKKVRYRSGSIGIRKMERKCLKMWLGMRRARPMDIHDIAKTLNVSSSTVSSHISKAVKYIRRKVLVLANEAA